MSLVSKKKKNSKKKRTNDGVLTPDMDCLKKYLSQLLLLVPPGTFEVGSNERVGYSILSILEGKSEHLFEVSDFKEILHLPQLQNILQKYSSNNLIDVLNEYVDQLIALLDKYFGKDSVICLQILGVACLQSFVQANFTGPPVSKTAQSLWFPNENTENVQAEAIKLLSIEGQQAYDLMQEPLFLVMSELIFERLLQTPPQLSLFSRSDPTKLLDFVTEASKVQDPITASLRWWKVRGLQVHLSVVSEPPSIILSVCGIILNSSLVNAIAPPDFPELQKLVQIQFLLEVSRIHIHSSTEHAAVSPLIQAKKLSDFQLLLSGAKAKRTKFQNFFTSNLIVLAKSSQNTLYEVETSTPESFQLDSDLLLEKPQYESLEDLEIEIEQDTKRIRYDSFLLQQNTADEKLLPLAMKQEDIPAE